LPSEWLSGDAEVAARTRGHLRRLFETPALAAFYQHAFALTQQLRQRLGSEPPAPLLHDEVARSPALDPRAEELRRRFLESESGVSSMPARLRQAAPLCPAGCPECVGGDDPHEAGDRLLLARLLGS
jgi:hypothetical protein